MKEKSKKWETKGKRKRERKGQLVINSALSSIKPPPPVVVERQSLAQTGADWRLCPLIKTILQMCHEGLDVKVKKRKHQVPRKTPYKKHCQLVTDACLVDRNHPPAETTLSRLHASPDVSQPKLRLSKSEIISTLSKTASTGFISVTSMKKLSTSVKPSISWSKAMPMCLSISATAS